MDLETKVLELYKQVQKLQDCLDHIETHEDSDSNDTEHLVNEEIHWFFKICRKFLCYC